MADKRLLDVRNAAKRRKPRFARQDSHKKVKLASGWRRPKGLQSKLRKRLKGHRAHVSVGYGSPAAVRDLSREGLAPTLVHSIAGLDAIDKKTQGVLISSTIGTRNKVSIVRRAQEKGLTILNVKDPAAFLKAVDEDLARRKASRRAKRRETKEKEKETAQAGTAASKEKDTTAGIEEALDAEEKKVQEKKELDKALTTRQ